MKKNLMLVLAMMLVASVLYGCSGGSGNGGSTEAPKNEGNNNPAGTETAAPPKEIVKLKYLVPSTEPRDYQEVFDLVNQKLKEDGLNIEIEKVFIPSDAWDQKINLMLSTGEEFDLFHIMQDRTPFSNYLNRGALADITEAVEKYGQNIKKVIPDDIFEGGKVDGRIYVVPSYWVEMASEGEFNIRLDLLEQNNLEMPTNPDELLAAMDTVMKNWTGSAKPYLVGKPNFDPVAYHTTVLHRTYDSFPFTVKEKLVYVDQNANIKSWFETEEFKKDAEFMRKAYTMGLINPDILVLKGEQVSAQVDNGDWFVGFGTSGNLKALQKNNPNATVADLDVVYFNTEKPYLRPLTVKNANGVSITSKHPDEAVQFIDWLYASQENYDLFQYGIEGKHYEKDGDKGIIAINDPTNDNKPGYKGSESQIGNINLMRVDHVNNITANNKVLYERNPEAINSIAANFVFDPTNVKTEYSNVVTEAAASITPIYMGVLEYDKAFPAAIEKMKKAGLDIVVEEFKKQFEAWYATQQ